MNRPAELEKDSRRCLYKKIQEGIRRIKRHTSVLTKSVHETSIYNTIVCVHRSEEAEPGNTNIELDIGVKTKSTRRCGTTKNYNKCAPRPNVQKVTNE